MKKSEIETPESAFQDMMDLFPEEPALIGCTQHPVLSVIEYSVQNKTESFDFCWFLQLGSGDEAECFVIEKRCRRSYKNVGEMKNRPMEVGNRFETRTKSYEVVERNGKLCLRISDKIRVTSEEMLQTIFNDGKEAYLKEFRNYLYERFLPVYLDRKPVWLVGVRKLSRRGMSNVLYIGVESGDLVREQDILFEHQITLALPGDEFFRISSAVRSGGYGIH